jgi:site-specific recombinase XerD
MSDPHTRRPPAPAAPRRSEALQQEVAAPRRLTDDDRSFLARFDKTFVAFTEYARFTLDHSEASCRGYRGAYQNLRRFLVDTSAGDAADRMYAIAEWVAWNRKRGCTAVSTNTYWRSVKPFYAFLEKRDGIQNPFRDMKMPPKPASLPKARTPDECRRILAAALNYPWLTEFQRARAGALFGVLIFAGLRRGEVTRLLFTDVDLEGGIIHITRGKGRYGGKDRTAYINTDLRELLDTYIRSRNGRSYVCPEFFVSTQGGQGLSAQQFIRIVKEVRRASGVDFSIHSLRHSFVTMLLQSGIPLHVAKELAGHTDIATTAGYLRVWDEEKREQILKLSLGAPAQRRRFDL